MKDRKILKVIELFAGVGGFRLGLEAVQLNGTPNYEIVWSNQWEPSTKVQHASDIYIKRFGKKNHSNENIFEVKTNDIPDHDVLVGGFPCQDYSVARTLSKADGLEGKKGVLWWQIYRIIKEKENKPKYLILENVDRLLKSPANRRGKDFAIMLSSLANLGYAIEWRVINAAEYGFPQRRRRVFILGYHHSTDYYKKMESILADDNALNSDRGKGWIFNEGIFAKAFPILEGNNKLEGLSKINEDVERVSNEFSSENPQLSPFKNSGLMIKNRVLTINTKPNYSGEYKTLGDIIERDENIIPDEFFINDNNVEKWKYFKGSKKESRTNKSNGFTYNYSEGSMIFPDPIDKPSRTIVTGEGGTSASRFKHAIKTESGKLRRLLPEELEQLNGFPKGHTKEAMPTKRAFFMGNALVVGIIEKLGTTLAKTISNE